MSPAGRRTDSSHEGNKYGGASPPDSIMLPLGEIVLVPVTTGRHSEVDWLYYGVRRFL